ncbi:MAG: restriction endonuclease subunit S [Leptospiraceae bacterium]
MSGESEKRRIRELCDITSSRRIKRSDYRTKGIPFYRGKEIIERNSGAQKVSTEIFLDPEYFQELKSKYGAPAAGDLLLTSVGTLGVPYIVKPGDQFYFKDANLTWFRNISGLNVEFLYYWLLAPEGRAQLSRCVIGSSQSAYTIAALKEMEIPLPPLETQKKIAGILSAYDDLIENNLRRIRILEEMARALYREWFVYFRFPGHEKAKFVDSSMGRIPEGWEVKKVGEVCDWQYGKSLKSSDRTEGPFPVYGSSGVVGWHNEALVPGPKIIVGRKGNVGSVFYESKDFYPIDTVFFVSSAALPLEYLFFDFQSKNFINNDAAVPGLNREQARSLPLLVPDARVLEQFRQIVKETWRTGNLLKAENKNLTEARQMLLPQLIGGRLV